MIKVHKLKTNLGFTLADLMVSISIIVLLTLTAVMSFIRAEKSQNLINSAEALASQIRAIENLSLAGKEINGVVPLGGYGIQFSKPDGSDITYLFFADMNRDLIYDTGATFPSPLNLVDVEFTPKNNQPLKKDVFISEFKIDDITVDWIDPDLVSILFKTPTAKVYICKNTPEGWDCPNNISSVTIILAHRKIGNIKTIKIYPTSRQISVE